MWTGCDNCQLCARLLAVIISWASVASAASDAIEGVQAAALDQPRIYLNLRRTVTGPALKTAGKEPTSGIEAFLDTGASGILLSKDTADKLGIHGLKAADGRAVAFEDVGIAGAEKFGVSEPLFVAMAAYPRSDPETGDYSQPQGPFRAQIRPGGGLLDLIAPGMDVAGVPAIAGKIVVLDPTPLAKFDKIHTSVLAPGDAAIPRTRWHVPLTPVSFAKFTRITPAGADGPHLSANPMIGPDPFKPGDSRPPVRVIHHGKTVAGTFLLDSGAATSILSIRLARQLGLRVGDNGDLPEVPKARQFQLTIGGLGGGKQSTGTFFDRLELPTQEGPPVTFVKAPFVVSDVTAVDVEGKPFTIDGVIGMNYLVASAEVTGGLLPDIGKIVDGPFKWIVIDLKQGVLGLEPR